MNSLEFTSLDHYKPNTAQMTFNIEAPLIALRKTNNLTRQDVAELLHVSKIQFQSTQGKMSKLCEGRGIVYYVRKNSVKSYYEN